MKKYPVKQRKIQASEFNLADRLKYLRESRSMTQKQLADLASVSQATIAHIEKSTKDPSIEMLRKISEALDIHIAILFSTNDLYVFDLKRLRRKYNSADKLTPHMYMAIGRVVQYAKDIGFIS